MTSIVLVYNIANRDNVLSQSEANFFHVIRLYA